ncbi:MAG: hypothetical protein SGPRY_005138 [Prymnesium sp.]
MDPDIAISYIDDVSIYGVDTLEHHLGRVAVVIDRVGEGRAPPFALTSATSPLVAKSSSWDPYRERDVEARRS